MMREATPCSSATIFRSTFNSSAAALECSGAGRGRGTRGKLALRDLEDALDGREDGAPNIRALEALGDRAEPTERFDVARVLQCYLVDRVVLQHTSARHVAGLRLALTPGGKRLKDGKLARLLDPELQPLPSVLRVRAVGVDVGQDRHLLVEPGRAVLLGKLGGERAIDVAQVRNVGDRVGDLLRRERPVRPVREAGRLVDLIARHAEDELVVAHLIAVAADHRRDLRVEERVRHGAGLLHENLDVLSRCVEDFDHALVGHQAEEGREVDPGGEGVDNRRFAGAGHLDQAELRPKRALPHELRVDGDKGCCGESGAEGEKLCVISDNWMFGNIALH